MNWNRLEAKGEIDHCECGKKIWIYWHRNIDGIKHAMTKCGPCYFKEK